MFLHNKKKAEETAINILYKIPAFEKFASENSMLASLFGRPSNYGTAQSLAGLQTRASVNTLIQNRIAAGGPNAAAQISANMQAAQAELTKLKDKVLKAGAGNTDDLVPPSEAKGLNTQKTKTFAQRIDIGSDIQFGKPNRFVASQINVAISIGYKLSNKNTIGVTGVYKVNYGAINNFYLEHGGFGVRSFCDYKLKKQFFITGSYEINYNQAFKNFSEIRNANGSTGIGDVWQNAGLIGITKKINVKTKWVKGTKLQLLYDIMYNTHAVPTQPVVFRMGYNF